MHRLLRALAAAAVGTALLAPATLAQTPSADGDDKVTGRSYVRYDGGSDAVIAECNDTSTDPAADDDPADGDVDSNDGGSRRQGNEPSVAVDPSDPDTVVAGWNDYCSTDRGVGWQGLAFSRDRGETWTDSLVPGYPGDTSAGGRASPLRGRTDAGDPLVAFDRQGNLYVGGISFNRTGPILGSVFVASYSAADGPNGYPVTYQRTRIVARGTPSRNFQGIFQDKPMLEVDRTGGRYDGNVYVCWSRFTGFGQNKIFFSRSTDQGRTFSRPMQLTVPGFTGSVQGCDIAIEHDGDVYVTFRTFASPSRRTATLAYARSANGGASFTRAATIRAIVPYFPFDTDRSCGDGPFHCPSDFVFFRASLEARATADQNGDLPGVYLVYNEIRPGSIERSNSTYRSAGAGTVGQSLNYMIRTLDNGRTWSPPVAIDPAAKGHQFFADVDALDGTLAVMWQDSRTDPAYSVQHPMGNKRDAAGRAVSSGTNIVNSYLKTSTNGTSFGGTLKVSSVGHQPDYEMFGSRNTPFQGDYNWISLATRADGSLFGYMTWTDNRDVVPGADPRETEAQDGFVDGFDVLQCRIDLATQATSKGSGPLARRDAPYTGDNCGNGGGLDQNIYGTSVVFDR